MFLDSIDVFLSDFYVAIRRRNCVFLVQFFEGFQVSLHYCFHIFVSSISSEYVEDTVCHWRKYFSSSHHNFVHEVFFFDEELVR